MAVTEFPDPRDASPDGVAAIGGDLGPETLLLAYRQGIFPWPMPRYPLLWFSPDPRGVLFFDDLQVPRRLARVERQAPFRLTFDRAFDRVIEACQSVHRTREGGTWITGAMARAYQRLHRLGHAHSVEAWEGEALVGGIYGVEVDGAFAAESMFYRRTNASKLALLHLVRHLQSRGLEWMDIQMLTPHMATLGGREIPRDDFLALLARTRRQGLRLFSWD